MISYLPNIFKKLKHQIVKSIIEKKKIGLMMMKNNIMSFWKYRFMVVSHITVITFYE